MGIFWFLCGEYTLKGCKETSLEAIGIIQARDDSGTDQNGSSGVVRSGYVLVTI